MPLSRDVSARCLSWAAASTRSSPEIDAKYDAIVAFADIGDFIDQPVKTYSSGMYVRLAFAVIAHADADILVIDEALSVGDVFFGQKCMRFLRDFQEHGTVLFVSHDAGAVINLCDRVVWMDDGRVAMDGSAKTVCEAYLASTYGHRPNRIGASAMETAITSPDAMTGADDAVRSDNAATESRDFDPALDQSRIRVFRFDPARAGFGDGGATISSVRFESGDRRPLAHVAGGEVVRVVVQARAHRDIPQPIIGFFLKDRLGQQLFGTNTYGESGPAAPAIARDATAEAVFEFTMPYLPLGRYTVDVAIADGTVFDHVQAAWVYDALVLESVCETRSTGLVGIPYRAIALRAVDPAEQAIASAASDGVPA